MGVIFKKFGDRYDEELLLSIENYMYDEGIEDISDIDVDDMIEYVRDNFISYEEVVTYYNAWQYIGDGVRLNNAIDLAVDFGYETKSLNVELLATLLKQQELEEELQEIANEL